MITGKLTKAGFEITRFVPTTEQSVLGKLFESVSNIDNESNLEEGSAEITIKLADSIITVSNSYEEVLWSSKVKKGFWDNIWRAIRQGEEE